MTVRRASILAALAGVTLIASGCDKEAVVHEAKTEGIYLDVGPLDYQVQLSRVLNPSETPDRSYFDGVAPEELDLPNGQAWFAVFIRVQNQTDKAEPMAATDDFEIVDTQENVYKPVAVDPKANAIAYEARQLEPNAIIPAVDSVAADGPTQGALLLFKLPFATLQNRPLEFKIQSPTSAEDHAVVDLDV